MTTTLETLEAALNCILAEDEKFFIANYNIATHSKGGRSIWFDMYERGKRRAAASRRKEKMKELENYCKELEIKDFRNELKIASESDEGAEFFFNTICNFVKKENENEIKRLKHNAQIMKEKLGCTNCIHCDESGVCLCGLALDSSWCGHFNAGKDFIEPKQMTEEEFYKGEIK